MSIKQLSVTDLKEKLANNEDVVLIDCREESEWNSGHIKEASFFPLSKLKEGEKIECDKDKQIVLQCRSGKRSMTACQILEEDNYTNLSNLEGGILAWLEQGYEVTEE